MGSPFNTFLCDQSYLNTRKNVVLIIRVEINRFCIEFTKKAILLLCKHPSEGPDCMVCLFKVKSELNQRLERLIDVTLSKANKT
jgi:hypothetical protein